MAKRTGEDTEEMIFIQTEGVNRPAMRFKIGEVTQVDLRMGMGGW